MAGSRPDIAKAPRVASPVQQPFAGGDDVYIKPGETIEQAARRYAGAKVQIRGCRELSAVGRFAQGAYYAPVTWWVAHLNNLAYHGAFGRRLKIDAQIHHSLFAQILWVVSTDPRAYDLALKVFAYLTRNKPAALIGRLAGTVFLNYAATGGGRHPLKRPLLPRKVTYPAALLNLTLASYGAGILGTIKGIKTVEKMMAMLATGSFEIVLCLPKIEDLEIDLEVYRHLSAFNNLIGMLNVTHQYVIHGEEMFQ